VAEAQFIDEDDLTLEPGDEGVEYQKITETMIDPTETEGLSEEQLKILLGSEITDAMTYINGTEFIADDRNKNYEYYLGIMNDVPSAAGRSSVTDRSVNSCINMMLPSLMRVFTSGKNIAVYEPVGEEDADIADLITRYVNDCVFRKDNQGDMLIRDWCWNGLVGKVGVVKSYYDENYVKSEQTYEGLSDLEFAELVGQTDQNPELEIKAHTVEQMEGPNPMVPGQTLAVSVHDLTVERTINNSTVKITNIDWDEFVISRDASNLEDAVLKSHRTFKRAGDLLALGYDEDAISQLPTYTDRVYNQKVNDPYYTQRDRTDSPDPMLREVLVHEGIIKCDYDGTGVKDWYFVAGGGENVVEVLKMEVYECQVVFSDFCPEPIPNLFFGRCPADSLTEIQKVQTVLTRMMLDSGYLAMTPQREVVFENLINPEQLTNLSPGAPVYVDKPGTIREIPIPFVGSQALTMLQHFDQQAEARTGVSKQSMGLNPNALSNQSATAANIAYSASLGKVEMIARIFADGGMRKLFQGVLKQLIKYQDYSRIIRMDGEAMAIDPRQWEMFTDMDVSISTGLGTGNKDRDMAMMNQIVGKQEAIISQFGPNSPLVDLNKYSRALQDMAEASGIKNPELYFGEIPVGYEPPGKGPDKDTLEAQRKAQKDQMDFQVDMMELQLKARGLALKEAEVQISAGNTMSPADIQKLQLSYEKMLIEAELKRTKIAADAELKLQELDLEARLEKYAIDQKSRSGQGIIPG